MGRLGNFSRDSRDDSIDHSGEDSRESIDDSGDSWDESGCSREYFGDSRRDYGISGDDWLDSGKNSGGFVDEFTTIHLTSSLVLPQDDTRLNVLRSGIID